jgi:uncharacterized protein (DUF697 family)
MTGEESDALDLNEDDFKEIAGDDAEVAEIEAEAKRIQDDVEVGESAEFAPEAVQRAQREYLKDAPRANVMIIGDTGVGKSTLINAVFGEKVAKVGTGKPVTENIDVYQSDDCQVRIYDTRGLEIEESGKRLVKQVKELIEKKQLGPVDDRLHIVWFCIPGVGGLKFQEASRDVVTALVPKIPVVFVTTQVPDGANARYLDWLANHVNIMQLGVVENRAFATLAEPIETDAGSIPAHGVGDLVAATITVLPEAAARAMAAAVKTTEETLSIKEKDGRKIVWAASAASATAGAAPVPFADAPVIGLVQLAMLAKLNAIFAFGPEDAQLKQLTKAVLIDLVAATGGKALAGSIIKMFPGIGSVAGGAINASVAGLVTLCLGEVYMKLLAELAQRRAKGEPVDIEGLAEMFKPLFKEFMKSRGSTVPRPK